jgi:RNAse (barnase) inhibitor barstar
MITETAIAEIAGGKLDVERIRDIRQAIDLAKQQVRRLEDMWDSAMLEHVQAVGPVVIGDVKYYAGVKKSTKCRDVRQTLAMFLAVSDIDTLADCLSSNAFKPGAARLAIAPDQWDECFVVEEQAELKEGKPVKSLQSINTRFLKE